MTVRYLILLLTLLVSIGCGKDKGPKVGGGSWVSGGGGGGASSVPVTSVTYSPGGTAATGVYTTWSSLYSDVGNTTGVLIVGFDCSHVSSICSIPSGTWDFASTYLQFTGPTNPNPGVVVSTVDFASGALMHTPPLLVRNVKLRTSAATAPIQVASGRGSSTYEFIGSASVQALGTAPVITIDTASGEIVTIALYDRSNLLNGSTGGGTSSLRITGSATFAIPVITGNAQLATNSFGAPTGAQTLLQYTDAANLNTSQTGILDTHTFGTVQQLSKAAQESYTATTSSDWDGGSPPTNVGAALDRAAAALNAAGHKP